MSVVEKFKEMKDYIGWGSDVQPEIYNDEHQYHDDANKIHSIATIFPRSFNDARAIGESFRSGMTTVVNLESLTDADGRRIVDFMSGLVLALNGQIERAQSKVFILTPDTIQVVAENAAGSNPSTGFFNIG